MACRDLNPNDVYMTNPKVIEVYRGFTITDIDSEYLTVLRITRGNINFTMLEPTAAEVYEKIDSIISLLVNNKGDGYSIVV